MDETNELLKQILQNTTEIRSKVDDLHERVEVIEQKLIEFEHSLEILKQRLQILEEKVAEVVQRLMTLENIVTTIQVEHGEKIQVLFDYFVSTDEEFKLIRITLSNINTSLDKHDNRIYLLETKLSS